jgi:hypothetical protein
VLEIAREGMFLCNARYLRLYPRVTSEARRPKRDGVLSGVHPATSPRMPTWKKKAEGRLENLNNQKTLQPSIFRLIL